MASIQQKLSKSGEKTFYVVVSFAGRHRWIKAGTASDAKKLKKDIEALENSQRIEKLGLTTKRVRIDDFLEEYTEHVRLHNSPNTLKRYRAALNAFLAFLRLFHPKVTSLDQILPETIEDFQRRRLESLELKTEADGDKPGNHARKKLPLPQTVNYEFCVLRSALIWAQRRGLISTVPTRIVRKLKPKPSRKARILSQAECRKLLAAAESVAKSEKQFQVYAQALRFLLNTGLRSGELCNLCWEDIDLKSGLIKIQAKNDWTPKSYGREFFLNKSALDVLRSLKTRHDYVFADGEGRRLQGDSLRTFLIRAAGSAGLTGFTRVHDLRHTFNSLMQMNGVDPATMGKILGHKDIETTMIYTHQTAEHLKKSIEKVGI